MVIQAFLKFGGSAMVHKFIYFGSCPAWFCNTRAHFKHLILYKQFLNIASTLIPSFQNLFHFHGVTHPYFTIRCDGAASDSWQRKAPAIARYLNITQQTAYYKPVHEEEIEGIFFLDDDGKRRVWIKGTYKLLTVTKMWHPISELA